MKRDWLQLISNIGVIIGLIVLIYEVNQSNSYAEADNASVSAGLAVNREISVVGENAAAILAKAIDDPDSLNTQELVVIDAYHRQLLMELMNQAYQAELGIFSDDWEEGWGNYIRLHLDYPFGRKWWSLQRHRMLGDSPAEAQVSARVIDRALGEQANERQVFFRSLKSGN